MTYSIITKINNEVFSQVLFSGHIDTPEIFTFNPVKHCKYNYYYFIINNAPRKVLSTDIMTIEQINIDG